MSRASGVGQRAGEPVELGHDELVAGAAGGERFAEAGTGASRAAQAVVDVDAVGLNAEPGERVTLGGEVLLVGGDAGVADQQSRHDSKCVPYVGRSPAHITEPPLRHTPPPLGSEVPAQGNERVGGGSLPYAASAWRGGQPAAVWPDR